MKTPEIGDTVYFVGTIQSVKPTFDESHHTILRLKSVKDSDNKFGTVIVYLEECMAIEAPDAETT